MIVLKKIWNVIKQRKEVKILMIGLDASGKTCILYTLKGEKPLNNSPTTGFNVESILHNNISLTIWEVGGGNKTYPLWAHYYQNSKGIIFVIDCNDKERMEQAKTAFKSYILDVEEWKDAIILFFANKCDIFESVSVEEIIKIWDLEKECNGRHWTVQRCCAISGEGLREGLDWLTSKFSVQ